MSKDFDSFLKELVQERIDEISCPPKEEVWQQIKMKLKSERKNEKIESLLMRLKPIYAACVVIILLIILYMTIQTPVMALMNNVIKKHGW